jgi:hypothetical protein
MESLLLRLKLKPILTDIEFGSNLKEGISAVGNV